MPNEEKTNPQFSGGMPKPNNSNSGELQPTKPDGTFTYKNGATTLDEMIRKDEHSKANGDLTVEDVAGYSWQDNPEMLEKMKAYAEKLNAEKKAEKKQEGPDEFGISFPKYKDYDPKNPTASMGMVNPNWHKLPGYGDNCQRCYATFELRCRGYDVTAKPRPSKEVFASKYTNSWQVIHDFLKYYDKVPTKAQAAVFIRCTRDYLSVFKGLDNEMMDFIMSLGEKPKTESVKSKMLQKLTQAPEGARFCLMIDYKGGGGHITNIVIKNGKPVLCESQSNEELPWDYYLSVAKPSSVVIGRLDDKEIDPSKLGVLMEARKEK